MYFSNGNHNQLVRFNVTTGEVDVFTPPELLSMLGNLQPFNDVTTAPDGVYFTQTTANVISKVDYETHEFTNFKMPTPLAVPLGIYYASDGGIWFLEFTGTKFGRLDRSDGSIKELPVPLSGAGPLVFACALGGALGSVNERTGEVVVYPESFFSNAVEVAQDYSDNIWISHAGQDTLGVFNPQTKNFTEIVMPGTILPTPVSIPLYGGSGIFSKPVGDPLFGHRGQCGNVDACGKGRAEIRPGTGNAIWFTQLFENRLFRFDLDGLVF